MSHSSTKSQITHLILLLLCAGGAALLLSFFLIFNYGPSGKYTFNQAFIHTNLVATLNYNVTNYRTNSLTHYIFDRIEVNYYNPTSKNEKSIKLDVSIYRKIYQLIQSDTSLLSPLPSEIEESFLSKETA